MVVKYSPNVLIEGEQKTLHEIIKRLFFSVNLSENSEGKIIDNIIKRGRAMSVLQILGICNNNKSEQT